MGSSLEKKEPELEIGREAEIKITRNISKASNTLQGSTIFNR